MTNLHVQFWRANKTWQLNVIFFSDIFPYQLKRSTNLFSWTLAFIPRVMKVCFSLKVKVWKKCKLKNKRYGILFYWISTHQTNLLLSFFYHRTLYDNVDVRYYWKLRKSNISLNLTVGCNEHQKKLMIDRLLVWFRGLKSSANYEIKCDYFAEI